MSGNVREGGPVLPERGTVAPLAPKAEQAKPKTIAIKAGDATQAIGTGGQS